MPATRAILALVAIALVAGGIVMQFFVILSGISTSPPNKVYFLEASTTSITNANDHYRNPARWTYLSLCGVENGLNANCGATRAAPPFDPARNFGTETGVPEQFIGTHLYYYLSRVAWAFYIIALFFSVITFFVSALAIFSRLGGYMTALLSLMTFIFQALASSLMTAWTVKARNAFYANDLDAHLGKYAYGFSWAPTAIFLIATILVCIGGSAGKEKAAKQSGYFGRKRSTRSRGSFNESTAERRVVKDEYE